MNEFEDDVIYRGKWTEGKSTCNLSITKTEQCFETGRPFCLSYSSREELRANSVCAWYFDTLGEVLDKADTLYVIDVLSWDTLCEMRDAVAKHYEELGNPKKVLHSIVENELRDSVMSGSLHATRTKIAENILASIAEAGLLVVRSDKQDKEG